MSKDTGGPAFPTPSIEDRNGCVQHGEDGMTLRDYFAAKAMQTILGFVNKPDDAKKIASVSYQVADAMLAERAK